MYNKTLSILFLPKGQVSNIDIFHLDKASILCTLLVLRPRLDILCLQIGGEDWSNISSLPCVPAFHRVQSKSPNSTIQSIFHQLNLSKGKMRSLTGKRPRVKIPTSTVFFFAVFTHLHSASDAIQIGLHGLFGDGILTSPRLPLLAQSTGHTTLTPR